MQVPNPVSVAFEVVSTFLKRVSLLTMQTARVHLAQDALIIVWPPVEQEPAADGQKAWCTLLMTLAGLESGAVRIVGSRAGDPLPR
mmetsp:Transcript_156470/g.277640  ORF Transcript_156470/g.277640 Transcript_156470/m.277640 type:complete len:86 (+) Transcript_156470:73-330(+)